jgi:predicted glycosyltransferase
MKFLFYLAHPAHFHLFKNTMRILKEKGHTVIVTIKTKDVLRKLLEESGLPFINIAEQERKDSRAGIAFSFLQRTLQHWKIVRKEKPDLFISTSAEFAPFARLLGVKSISVFEDDLEIFPVYSKIFVPFLHHQLCPVSCSAGQWNNHPKTVKYNANHELAYLRPAYFKPEREKVNALFNTQKMNIFIRFAKLTAWHDENKTGITNQLANDLIQILEPYGQIHLSSERPLPPELEKYRVNVKASDILDVLYYSDLYLGDSQTMTAEAAVLGTPSIRFNDFVGKLGYLEELEHTYHLTFGIPTNQPEKLLEKTKELIATPDLKEKWKKRKEKLLQDTIDPTKFFVWFFENYPLSAEQLLKDPSIQQKFRDNVS